MPIEGTRLPKWVMFEDLVGGTTSTGWQEEEWIGFFLGNLRAFAIQTEQWMTAAQDADDWHKTEKLEAGIFMSDRDSNKR